MNNEQKYGKGKDVIEQSLASSADFCYYSALKYAVRLSKISKMPPLKRLFYRVVLCKGHRRLDHAKMVDYLERMKKYFPLTAEKCYGECEKILSGEI